MRKAFLFILLYATSAGCFASISGESEENPTSRVQLSEADGLTMATAIVITGARNSREGIRAEYDWIDEHLPDAIIESQQLVGGDGLYDKFVIKLASGETRLLFFNITAFAHKQ